MKISNCNGVTIKRATSEGLYLAYKDLAKAAKNSGDISVYYNYQQHAEHYQREHNDLDQGNGNYHKRDENRGEVVRGNRKGNREKQVSSRGTLSQNGADPKGGTFLTQDIQAEDK